MRRHSGGAGPAHTQCVLAVASVVVGVLVGGCQWSPASSGPGPRPSARMASGAGPVSQQLIVKFAPHTRACTADGITAWSDVTHVRLTYVRPMSGDACVLIQWAESAAELARGQALLRRDPAIEWIEDDRVLHPL